MTGKVHRILRARDRALYSAAQVDPKKGIKDGKTDYREKIIISSQIKTQGREHRASQTTEAMYKLCGVDKGVETPQQNTATPQQPLPAFVTPPFTVKEHDVRGVLRAMNPKKAAGPDRVPGMVLKARADELLPVLINIFNHFLTHAVIPPCLKSTTIIPVPMMSVTECLIDYHPVALTSIIVSFLRDF